MNKQHKKLKKRILILILIILIFIFVMIKYLNKINISEKHILDLLNNGIKNVNYSVIDSDNTKIFVSGNIEKIVYSNGSIIYNDYDTGESIKVSASEKSITKYNNGGKNEGPHYSKYVDYFENDDYEYKYEGIENLSDNKCIVVSFLNKQGKDGVFLKQKMWINKKLGVIEKIEYYTIENNKEKLLNKTKYDMHDGSVSDSDISKPNLSTYKEYTINK